jgi:hypothetical protein
MFPLIVSETCESFIEQTISNYESQFILENQTKFLDNDWYTEPKSEWTGYHQFFKLIFI